MNKSVQAAAGHLGMAIRHKRGAQAVTEASRDLAAARIEAYVERIVAEAPPLTEEQRDKISRLLIGA